MKMIIGAILVLLLGDVWAHEDLAEEMFLVGTPGGMYEVSVPDKKVRLLYRHDSAGDQITALARVDARTFVADRGYKNALDIITINGGGTALQKRAEPIVLRKIQNRCLCPDGQGVFR